MGSLTLPAYGPIYLDANCFIYSVERVAPYVSLMDDVWNDVRVRHLPVVTSELTLLEVLTKPFKASDTVLETSFRDVLLSSPDVRLLPITQIILERAARLRALPVSRRPTPFMPPLPLTSPLLISSPTTRSFAAFPASLSRF